MRSLLECILLGEAAPPQQQPQQPQQQQPGNANDPSTMVQQSAPPPDFTTGDAGGDNGNQPDTTDPNAGPPQMPAGAPQGGLDPSMGGAYPNAGSGDPNMQGQDPNAAGMDPNDPNAQQQDTNAMGGDPSMMGQDGGMEPQGPNADIEQVEKDVFSDLKPEQMILKNAELKERYQEVYKAIVDSLEKINKISRTSYDDTMLDFIVKKMTNLKSMIVDSVEVAFHTRTYVENKIELQRYILAFNYLTNMMTQIYQSRLKRQQKIAELNKKTDSSRDPEEFPVFTRGYDIQ